MSKILIVEDDLSIQALLHDFIQEAGHSVVLASDGVEALAKYSGQDFDLVLLDIMLPKSWSAAPSVFQIHAGQGQYFLPLHRPCTRLSPVSDPYSS